jgi:hypothetical protein
MLYITILLAMNQNNYLPKPKPCYYSKVKKGFLIEKVAVDTMPILYTPFPTAAGGRQ